MPGFFERARHGGTALSLDSVETSILRSLAVQMLELIGPGPVEDPDGDPLAALFTDGPTKKPDDPALARLFPDAYSEGPEADAYSSEFRRYTENDLRARKREDALALIRTLDAAEEKHHRLKVVLGAEDARHWLGALNDLRLTLAARLDVRTDEDELDGLPDDDERKPQAIAYMWLGGLQESLIDSLPR